jgi:HopA1 effector protein family
MSEELLAALASVRVDPSGAVEILGRRQAGLDPAEALYAALHCRSSGRGAAASGFTNWPSARDFADRLSTANAGHGTWQHGWAEHGSESDGWSVVERHGVRFRVPAAEVRTGAVRIPKEHFELIPGFYLAHGDADGTRDDGDTVRIYWHAVPSGAERLVALTTRLLNEAAIGFQLKLVSEPLRYDRTDAAVLYLSRRDCARAIASIERIHGELGRALRPTVSLLVKRLAPGVGFAEDPGDGSSFGEHRCRLLATILTDAKWSVLRRDAERAEFIRSRLAERGYRLDRMYLNPGSADDVPPLGGAGL